MPYDPNGFGLKDPSGKTEAQVADAVSRITGLGRTKPAPAPMAEAAAKPTKARGDSSAFMYDLPPAQDSQDQEIPDHEMPRKEPEGDMYGAKALDIHLKNVSRKVESQSMSKTSVNSVVGNLQEYRSLAGLTPLYEGQTGEVPTGGVNSDNAVNGGLPGLQGKALQNVAPEHQVADDDEVGDDKYTTFDDAIAMLKKEGVDVDALWGEFLEQRGLSVDLFNVLVDEAIESNDADEMDSILALEGIFMQALPQLLPEGLAEGLMDIFRKKGNDEVARNKEMLAKNKQMMQTHGISGIKAANARGVSPDAVVPLTQKKPEYKQDFSQGTRRSRSISPTRKMATGESTDMGSIMGKYGLQESKSMKPVKKGLPKKAMKPSKALKKLGKK